MAGSFLLIPHRDEILSDHSSSDQHVFVVIFYLNGKIFTLKRHHEDCPQVFNALSAVPQGHRVMLQKEVFTPCMALVSCALPQAYQSLNV